MDKFKTSIQRNYKDFYEPLYLALSSQAYPDQKPLYWDLSTPRDLKNILKQAQPSPRLFTNQDMVLLVDSTFISKEYASIIFTVSGQVFKSPEETRDIFQRIEAKYHIPYSWSKILGRTLGYDHKIPYVAGNSIFIPDRGTSKQNASWLSLHHIEDYLAHGSNQQILLKTTGASQLNLGFDAKIFDKQVTRALALYTIQYSLLTYLAKSFQIRDLDPTPQTNLIQNLRPLTLLESEGFSFEHFFTYLLAYHVNGQIREIIGEDNPYFEDLQDLLRSRLEGRP